MMEARPLLRRVGRALDLVPGMVPDLLLHAGPPIDWQRAAGPLRGALVGALLYERRARDENEARALIERGQVRLEPCHHHGAVGPMAGVISASMAVYEVENTTHGNRSYSNFNEGYGKVLRYGAYAPDVLERLRWINETFAPLVGRAIEASGGVDLRALIAEALHMGDEGHNRNKAGSLLFLRALSPHLAARATDSSLLSRALQFLGENALSVLNPVMAACKAMAAVAHDIAGSTLITTMARNGTDFGIRVSGLGETWLTAPAPTPEGLYFSGYSGADANPDIGDSTITETAGIGAFAMAAAPAIVTFISGTPRLALEATLEMYEISVAEHRHFTIPALDFRGTPTGIDLRKIVELGIPPRINTGIAHKDAGVGQIGAGLVRPPLDVFAHGLREFARRYSI
jgi:hypothetical protein